MPGCWRPTLVAFAIVCGVAAPSAHELSRSTARIAVDGRTVIASFAITAAELHGGPLADSNGDSFASVDEVDAAIVPVFTALKQHYRVSADNAAPSHIALRRYGLLADGTLQFEIVYTFAVPVGTVAVQSTLHELTRADHRHLLQARLEDGSHQAVLDASQSQTTFDATAPVTWNAARRYLMLGIEHIFTGYDHLAFLVVLLVGAATLIEAVKIVTAFTVAHSITLGLATFGIVSLPSAVIEILIALSIAWVAAETLLLDRVAGRWRLAFVFGLVHGFGFSNVLRDLELPPAQLALSLFSFNVGVEFGQLVFVLVVFPALYFAARRPWHGSVALTASSVVLCLGVYWFVQRLLLA